MSKPTPKNSLKKRTKRNRKVAGKKLSEKSKVKQIKNWMGGIKRVKSKKVKVKKELKPYRIVALQHKIEQLQEGIRELDHSDPRREKMVNRLTATKLKLKK